MKRRTFLQIAGTGAAGFIFSGCSIPGGAEEPPNIIFLLTDDQRWDTMGCMGNEIIQTPNMDRLAAEGTLFTNNFITTSICAPSRVSILTGQYQRRHGIDDFSKEFSPDAWQQTYPMLLRNNGYHTGFVGKFGIQNNSPLPEDDFDFFWGFSGQGQYFHQVNGERRHLTSIMGDHIEEFLGGAPPEKPFCLSVSFKAPHVLDNDPDPFQYDPELEDLYADVTIPQPATAGEKYFDMLPEFIQNSENRTRWKNRFATEEMYQRSVKGYYRLITGVDRAIGRIFDQLESAGQSENTVIILTGDNGFFLNEHSLAGKWLMYEESIRTPMVIRDPRLPSELQGAERSEMTLNIDVAPTILGLAGLEKPENNQGMDLSPLCGGESPEWRQSWFYEHHFRYGGRIPPSEGIRTDEWKYVRYIDQDPVYEQLFNLKDDPHEIENLAADPAHQQTLERLRKDWRARRESLE
jgi:arylsulfatase A-like enzyme